jgi:hypothetical protein
MNLYSYFPNLGACGGAVGWRTAHAGSIPDSAIGIFSLALSFRPHCGPGVDSVSNRNEYH